MENKIGSVKLYTLPETANILGTSNQTIYNYLRAGKLTGRKIGNKWKISEDELNRFMYPEAGQGEKSGTHTK